MKRITSKVNGSNATNSYIGKARQLLTGKRALHGRMSHSTVCNMTVSSKKALRTLVK